MMDEWRYILYPLGFISSIFFGTRILIQWMTSEIKQKSVVPKIFWQLSLLGNLSLIVHSLIQIQFHVFIIQVSNALISWRNINLMSSPKKQFSFKTTLYLLLTALSLSSVLFFILNHLNLNDLSAWFRIPYQFWSDNEPHRIEPIWHIIGFIGLTSFSSRFWIQWLNAEKQKESHLNKTFWWVSLIGDLLILLYFSKIKDPVNLIGPLFGLIPYIRNLLLLNKYEKKFS